MNLRQILNSIATGQSDYWSKILDQALDADASRQDFDGARLILTVERAERISNGKF